MKKYVLFFLLQICICNKVIFALENTSQKDNLYFQTNENSQIELEALKKNDHEYHFIKKYFYDERGNITKQTLFANLSGLSSSPKIINDEVISEESLDEYYSYDQNQLISSTKENDLETSFEYAKDGLIIAKFIKYKDHILVRHFYKYNDNKELIETITDNGSSSDINNLKNVTQRTFKTNTPTLKEESFLDQNSNKKILIKRVIKTLLDDTKKIKKDYFFGKEEKYYYSKYKIYDDNHNITEKTDHNNNKTFFSYNENDLLTEVTTNTNSKQITYDSNNNIIEECSKDKKTAYDYDGNNNLIKICDNTGSIKIYSYTTNNIQEKIVEEIVDINNNTSYKTIENIYDIFGNCISSKDSTSLNITYNFYNKPVSIIKNNKTTRNIYNKDGTLSKTIYPNKTYNRYYYDIFKRVTKIEFYSSEDNLLYNEEYKYDTFHLIYHKRKDNTSIQYIYDQAGRKIKEIDSKNNITSFFYDDMGNIETTILPSNIRVITKRDVNNNIIKQIEEDITTHTLLLKKEHTYDQYNNLIQTSYCDKDTDLTEYFFYNKDNQIIKHIDIQNNQTTYLYYKNRDQTLSIVKKIDSLGNIEKKTFNSLGHLLEIAKTNPLDQTFFKKQNFYDLLGNKTKEIFYSSKQENDYTITYEYDLDNNLISKEENFHRKTFFSYDINNNLKTLIKPDKTALNYTYNELNLLTELISSDKTIHYSYQYDKYGNLIKTKDHILNISTKKTYDKHHNLIEEKLNNNISIYKKYDNLGRIIQTILPDNSYIQYDFNTKYLRNITRFSSGDEMIYQHCFLEYNIFNKPKKHQLIKELGMSYEKEYEIINDYDHLIAKKDQLGRIVSIESSLFTKNFQYDDQNEITAETDYSYSYDGMYNLTSCNEKSFSYNDQNEISSKNTYYDENGNIIYFNNISLKYDALDRLIEVSKDNLVYQYIYDTFHRRTHKILHDLTNNTIKSTYFIYDQDKEIAALDENFNIFQLKVLNNTISSDIKNAVALEIDNKIYAPLYDFQGNIYSIVDTDSKEIAEIYNYSAFGLKKTDSSINNPWKFASKREDEETGFVLFGRRYYVPQIYKWLTPDPESNYPNLYTFNHNNSMCYVDNYGLNDYSTLLETFDIFEFESVKKGVISIFDFFGSVFQFVGRHLLPIPYISEAFILLGKAIQRDFSSPNFPPPSIQQINILGDNHPNARIGFLNGALHLDPKYNYQSGQLINAVTQGKVNIDLFYMPSKGFLLDMFECIFLKFNIETINSIKFATLLKTSLQIAKKENPNAKYLLIAHSKATLISNLVVPQLTEEEKNMLEIISVGPALILDPSLCSNVHNLVSKWDGVPFQNLWSLMNYFLFNNQKLSFLKAQAGYPLTDHNFTSETYQQALKPLILDFLLRTEVMPID
jgi:RHS repeat-associated protein